MTFDSRSFVINFILFLFCCLLHSFQFMILVVVHISRSTVYLYHTLLFSIYMFLFFVLHQGARFEEARLVKRALQATLRTRGWNFEIWPVPSCSLSKKSYCFCHVFSQILLFNEVHKEKHKKMLHMFSTPFPFLSLWYVPKYVSSNPNGWYEQDDLPIVWCVIQVMETGPTLWHFVLTFVARWGSWKKNQKWIGAHDVRIAEHTFRTDRM